MKKIDWVNLGPLVAGVIPFLLAALFVWGAHTLEAPERARLDAVYTEIKLKHPEECAQVRERFQRAASSRGYHKARHLSEIWTRKHMLAMYDKSF